MKTTKLIFTLICGICLAGLCGCEDNSRQYLDDYDTMVYFRNGGEQTITLYSVGNNARYAIPVCKSGSEMQNQATVRIVTMDQMQLDIYNMANETNFRQMPADCYEFLTATEMSFAAGEPYKVAVVELKTDVIRQMQEANTSVKYVLGMQIYSPEKVSSDINRLILLPEVDVPVVSVGKNGTEVLAVTPDSPDMNEVTSTLTLNMPASSVEWDFDCTIGVLGQEWLDAYNEANETEYALLGEHQYTIPETVHFTAGSNMAEFTVAIDRTEFAPFEFFVLPICLTSCSKPELQIDTESVYMIAVRLEPTLTQVALTEDMLSSPYTASYDGAGLKALVDGNEENFWHSCYGGEEIVGDDVYGSYIDVALKSPLNVVKFSYLTRFNNANAYPTVIRIGVSNDGENWEMIGEANESNFDMPTSAKAWGTLPTFYSLESFTHVRFGVAESKDGVLKGQKTQSKSTALGELQLEGAAL